ncbi:MAG: dockerin type I domain-containing protein [Candidatus Poribacteria bacterium]|nr:dockerin type I domain-containing protein [Candidatus Poribacteria bacterium]
MNLKNMLPVWGVLVLLFAASSGSAFAFSFDPPDEKTGAPNETTCMDCHVGNDLNAPGGSLMLTVPETYTPNEVYTIVVNLSRSGQSRWGFEMTALDGDGARAGSLKADDAANTQVSDTNSKQYIQHTSIGTAQGTNDAHSWEFQWTAPDADIGPITFYAAGNAANGDSTSTGDYIYTTQSESTPAIPVEPGVNFIGDVEQLTTDAQTGVTYTFQLTNEGNTVDTFTLEVEASPDATEAGLVGTVSMETVTLEADATQEITFKVIGNASTPPGAYDIDVIAISGIDEFIRVNLLTTTTIEMPVIAGVSLEVVGDDALSTTDAVEGVSYTLKVTNTGNMMDTVTLAASAEVGIEGSVLGSISDSERSIELEAGASAEITLKVTGDLFAVPGDYPISVTATSGTDDTMTAEATTTTTIEPPPTPWDVNNDGTVNIQDLVLVAGQLGESGEGLKGDINGDGTVNIQDLVIVASHLGEGTSGN